MSQLTRIQDFNEEDSDEECTIIQCPELILKEVEYESSWIDPSGHLVLTLYSRNLFNYLGEPYVKVYHEVWRKNGFFSQWILLCRDEM